MSDARTPTPPTSDLRSPGSSPTSDFGPQTSDLRPPGSSPTSDLGPPSSVLRPPSSVLRTWLPVGLFSLLWLDLIRLLSGPWEAREQYSYGWFVPFFAAALLWRRWQDRPLPVDRGLWTVDHGKNPEVSSQWSVVGSPDTQLSTLNSQPSTSLPVHGPSFLLSTFCFLLCLCLLPLRVIYEINTDWPLISWPYTLIVVTLTLYAFHLAGPKEEETGIRPSTFNFQLSTFSFSPWVKHFFFPVAFILIAVVWPYRIEQALIQGLMRVVAGITVELLGWLDVAAIQRGNLIEVSTGVLGVDEACSGIRSFQSSLMAALLMGELYRFRLWPRAALVAAGIILGFCFNIVRTLLLSYQADAQGLSAIDKWHDPAGMTITVACFFSLWAIALLMMKLKRGQWSVVSGHSVSDIRPPDSQPSTLNSQLSQKWSVVSKYLLAVGIWSFLCIAATEAWYFVPTARSNDIVKWSVSLPVENNSYRELTLTAKELTALNCDIKQGGSWREEDGSQWSVWFFGWTNQSLKSLVAARCHRPEVCLPSSGRKLQADHGLLWYQAGELKLPFRAYTFGNAGTSLHVFFCLWQDGTEQFVGKDQLGLAGRLWAAARGKRLLGQQTFEIIIDNRGSFEEAAKAVRQRLTEFIRVHNGAHAKSSPP